MMSTTVMRKACRVPAPRQRGTPGARPAPGRTCYAGRRDRHDREAPAEQLDLRRNPRVSVAAADPAGALAAALAPRGDAGAGRDVPVDPADRDVAAVGAGAVGDTGLDLAAVDGTGRAD